jgi:hypothetical protein
VAVGGGVDFHDEGREEDIHAQVVHSNETAAELALMSTEAIERVAKRGHVKAIPDENTFAVQGDDS